MHEDSFCPLRQLFNWTNKNLGFDGNIARHAQPPPAYMLTITINFRQSIHYGWEYYTIQS